MERQLRKILQLIKKMPVEATDVDQPFDDAPQDKQDLCVAEEVAPVDAPQDSVPDVQDLPKRGRPAGSKDKQPRRRCVSAAELPRPVTRRSAPVRKTTKRVQIESASEASSSAAEESPRTVRHRQYIEFRRHKQDAHQENVDKYVRLFDRMLA